MENWPDIRELVKHWGEDENRSPKFTSLTLSGMKVPIEGGVWTVATAMFMKRQNLLVLEVEPVNGQPGSGDKITIIKPSSVTKTDSTTWVIPEAEGLQWGDRNITMEKGQEAVIFNNITTNMSNKKVVEEEEEDGPPSGWDKCRVAPFDTPFDDFERNVSSMISGIEVTRYREGKKPCQYFMSMDDAKTKITFIKSQRKEETPLLRHICWIVDIKGILKGHTTSGFQEVLKDIDPDSKNRCFSINYDIPRKSDDGMLEVMFPEKQGETTSTDFRMWYWTLQYLKLSARLRTEINPFPIAIDKMWVLGDSTGDGSLSRNEVFDLLKKILNIEMKPKKKDELFSKCDRRGEGSLSRSDLERLVWMIKNHETCQFLWQRYADGVTRMKDKQLGAFMLNEQEMSKSVVDVEYARNTIKTLTGTVGGMDEKMFNIYLTQSSLNDGMDPSAKTTYQPMDRPWSDYHVKFACHVPTTPESDKSASPSALIGTLLNLNVKAFHCRLFGPTKGKTDDGCWVGDPQGRRQDCCLLRDYLSVFRDTAFQAEQSEYPIILIFEVCCKEKDQEIATLAIQEQLGFRLKDSNQSQVILCPSQAKKSYLVAAYATSSSKEPIELCDEWSAVTYFGCLPYKASASTTEKRMKRSNPYIVIMDWDQVDGQCESEGKWSAFRAHTYNWMAAYVPKKEGHEVYQIKELALVNGKRTEVECVWDDGVRVATAIAAGVNLAGINYHLSDIDDNSSQIAVASGRFLQNGNSGWVRKAKTKRHVPILNPKSESVVKETKKKSAVQKKKKESCPTESSLRCGSWKVVIDIISAHQLPAEGDFDQTNFFTDYDITDPCVMVRVDGLRNTQLKRTRVVQDNGFNPVWGEEMIFEVEDAEEAIITFTVAESDLVDTVNLAMISLPVSCLRSGYRCIFLNDPTGNAVSELPSLFFRTRFQRRGDIVHLIETEQLIRSQLKDALSDMDSASQLLIDEQAKIVRVQKATAHGQTDKKKIDAELKSYNGMEFSLGIFSFFVNFDKWKTVFCMGEVEEEEEVFVEKEAMPINVSKPPTREEREKRTQVREQTQSLSAMRLANSTAVGSRKGGSVASSRRQSANENDRRLTAARLSKHSLTTSQKRPLFSDPSTTTKNINPIDSRYRRMSDQRRSIEHSKSGESSLMSSISMSVTQDN